MTRYLAEEWKEVKFPDKLRLHYAISNFGRLKSFRDTIENGRILNLPAIDGYPVFRYKTRKKEKIYYRVFFARKLVAQYFLPPPQTKEHTFVILLDRNRSNNWVGNLQWATRQEMINHFLVSPYFIKARWMRKKMGWGRKLTATQVQFIKQKLFDPNRKTRLKILAKKFGVTTMTLERIRTGENWGYVAVKVNGKTMTRIEKRDAK